MSGQKSPLVHNPVFRSSSLFEGLSELELNAFAAFLEPRCIKSGELIFDEGTAGYEMFVLISGKISAWANYADGTRHWIFDIKPGDFFGEMSVIDGENRSATLITQTDAELLVLHGIDFYRIIYEHPMIGIKILKTIGRIQNIWLDQSARHLHDIMRWGETARRRAVTDELTGLYNRRFLEESANDRFMHGSVGLRSVSLMMMDLDNIHEINSRHGIRAGDLLLISAAEVLRSSTMTRDICARLSGDEFAVLLPDTKHEDARLTGERIRQAIISKKVMVPENPDGTGQIEITVSTSIGIASAPVHADTWEDLSSVADRTLRRAKELGKNRVEVAG